MNENTADREIATTRILNAPRELVWKVWTDPKHIALWWGPKGFTNTIHKMDVRPGGEWLFMMHGPDGTDYPNKVVYTELKKLERIVYIHGDESKPGYFHVTVTFEDQGRKTKLSMRALFPTAAERAYVVEKHNAIQGMNENMDRLIEYLKKV
jgi:uncharacterized protein YndB with AHSA1/START domain